MTWASVATMFGVALKSASHPRAAWWRRLWLWMDISTEAVEEIEIDPARCSHDHIVVADYQETRRVGLARYVCLLLECSQCHDIWRVQHRVNEQEAARMAARADETLQLLLDNRFKGQRDYSPYHPAEAKPRRKRKSAPRRRR